MEWRVPVPRNIGGGVIPPGEIVPGVAAVVVAAKPAVNLLLMEFFFK